MRCNTDCVVHTASIEIIAGSSSSLETSIYPSLTNALANAGLPTPDDRVLDFSEDKSLSLDLVDADVHAETTFSDSKDAESLVNGSSFVEMHF